MEVASPSCHERRPPRRRTTLAVLLIVALLLLSVQRTQASCQVPNCRRCSTASEFMCEECEGDRNKYILWRGQCSPRGTCGITGCEVCVDNSISRCALCKGGYTLTSNGLCASRVVCDMHHCEVDEVQTRTAHTSIDCNPENALRNEKVYTCIRTRAVNAASTSAGAPGALLGVIGALVATVASVGAGF
ncbi:hypothetical protein NESM_000810900 [Novymonas esmeraldas]|uniref:Uncharacterized protein n=1 Tax=Novymonas esmeraldas TaxID=1808958 RepID=A0AAW0EZM5_9TRYP